MQEEINNILSSLNSPTENTGLVVGLIADDHRSVYGFGTVSDENNNHPDGDTIYEIGSITKVFTAALLSVIVSEGLLNLDDQVRKLVPELSNLPPEITLRSLASHTSGLPKMPSNFLRSMRQDRQNPFAAYTTEDLLEYLTNYKPKPISESTGQTPSYSNIGAALLGYILGQKLRLSYEDALTSKICEPLEMRDTLISLTPEQQTRLATPHKASGKPGHNWDMPGFAGAGALRSTANDQLKFLAANLGSPHSEIIDALQACLEISSAAFPPPGLLYRVLNTFFRKGQDTSHYEQNVGLGWHIGSLTDGGQRVFWRHGATDGYLCFLGFVKVPQIRVVVLANRGLSLLDPFLNISSIDHIGFTVLKQLNSSSN
ncbi:MAG: beta-lactamase family protein [Chloroflexi bacterium]|nr:beta-lactamase family protein [Chloroflexota bacterium]